MAKTRGQGQSQKAALDGLPGDCRRCQHISGRGDTEQSCLPAQEKGQTMTDPIDTPGNPADPPEHETLMDALLAVQAETGDLQLVKDSEGAERGAKKDKYLSLDKLTAATRPLLNRHGL